MATFITAYRITKEHEGGYHNASGVNSNDLGGETFKGIARRPHPNWSGWTDVDRFKTMSGFPNNALNDPALNLKVLEFYKKNFWDVYNLDNFHDQGVANEMFDTGVNMGTGVAARFLQRSLNMLNRQATLFPDLTVDGVIGPVTISRFNGLSGADRRACFNLMNVLQGARYVEITERNPTQEVFIRGWLERVELMRRS